MKPQATYQKLRGGYYTPQPIADFLARWAIQSPTASILEPSCGNGVLLEAALHTLIERGADKTVAVAQLHGVELDPKEASKARVRITLNSTASATIHTGDFFAYCKAHLADKQLFDAVIGNPPFIRYQNFPEPYRSVAMQLMQDAGLHPNRLTNAWVPFLVATTLLLNKAGRIAMVIPAELLQVNYAAELRRFLSEYYSYLTLITFKRLLFDGVQQEVVLLLGERNGREETGIRTVELQGMDDLQSYQVSSLSGSPLKHMDHSTEKWTLYFLEDEEIQLLRTLKADTRLTMSGKVIDVDVGIVTGLNEFFVVTEEQVRRHSLEPYVLPIVGRSAYLSGAVFSHQDWQSSVKKASRAFLLNLPDASLETLPPKVQDYILLGEARGIHTGYKCRIRKRWYTVPSIWVPDAFMLRQVHQYPKIIFNEAAATCTDTIHRVRLRNGTSAKTVGAAFLNSLTFAFSEVTGRSYGGGVLELEPREAERLPLPLTGADALDLDEIDRLLRRNNIQAVLDMTDEVLLKKGLGLSDQETKMLREIWEKLRDRRINRKPDRAVRR